MAPETPRSTTTSSYDDEEIKVPVNLFENEKKTKKQKENGSSDVAEEGDAAQRPVARIDVGLEVDGADVGGGAARRVAVDGALVGARVLALRGLRRVDVHHRHGVVDGPGLGLDQPPGAPVQRGAYRRRRRRRRRRRHFVNRSFFFLFSVSE